MDHTDEGGRLAGCGVTSKLKFGVQGEGYLLSVYGHSRVHLEQQFQPELDLS